ncbi:MAG: type II toxin-antitoxin system HicA family toxin [Armatimonadota bacterium]|nr:type II toxin-antitoxin system HicA family toxin [Armatimonadota bacterium]
MRAVSGKELIRILRKHGWDVSRIEGSHHVLTRPGRKETLSVPVRGNRTLRKGTVRTILRLVRVSLEEE